MFAFLPVNRYVVHGIGAKPAALSAQANIRIEYRGYIVGVCRCVFRGSPVRLVVEMQMSRLGFQFLTRRQPRLGTRPKDVLKHGAKALGWVTVSDGNDFRQHARPQNLRAGWMPYLEHQ